MGYPFKLYINPVKEPNMDNILRRAMRDYNTNINDKRTAIKLGCRLKPIRNDIFIGSDRKTNKTFLAIPKNIQIIKEKNYFIFNKKLL